MRVLLNSRDIGGLDPRLERRLWGRRNDKVVEGVALSAEQSVAARARQLQLLLGGAVAAVAILLALNLVIVVVEAPQVMGYVFAALAGAMVAIGALVFGLYALMLRDHRRRVDARTSAGLPSGTAVRLDATSLAVGGQTWPWLGLTVEELGIRERHANKQRVTYVELLSLSDGHRSIPLDALFLSNGRAVLEQAWYRTRPAGVGV